MACKILIIAATIFVATGHTLAADPYNAGMRVTSSDATARFMALGVSKSVVIDLPRDIKNMMIADKGIVNAAVLSKRRVSIIGLALGQTNLFFFDADGRQIDALDIAVLAASPPATMENYKYPSNTVLVYRGALGQYLSCTPSICIDANKPGSDQPPGTQNINVTGSPTSVSVSPK